MRENLRSLVSVFAILVVLLPIFSPVVNAMVIYGPETYIRNGSSPDMVVSTFSVSEVHGNYTMFIRNGDGITNSCSSAMVKLNGETIVKANEFNQNVQFIQKNIAVGLDNELGVEIRSMPGSTLTVWIEDETPDIQILSPWDDNTVNGPVTITGIVMDKTIPMISIDHNGVLSTAPVSNGNFSFSIDLVEVNNITISAVDCTGTLRTASLLLDGDMLPENIERQLGFNPLNPDSDCPLTQGNESGNGIPDGIESFDGMLPVFAKVKIGADLFDVDTDDDGLTDQFELIKMGLYTDVDSEDTDDDGVSDADEDFDEDGLTNIEEQSHGTDPLVKDTDKDTLSDDNEILIGSNPLVRDTDSDGLDDDSEVRLGTNITNPDTDGDGILDGDEIYTSTGTNATLGISVSVTGKGDLSKQLRISRETFEYYTNISALVSPLVDVTVNGSFDSAMITMEYDPALDPSNLSLCYYDESLGLYVPVESYVDTANHKISANVDHLSMWGVFEVENLQALYKMVSDFNNEPYYGQQPGIPQPGDTLFVPYNSTLTMTFVGSESAYNNKFGLWSPYKQQYGTGHGTSPGTSFNLGTFTHGTELIFYLVNGVGNTWLSGPGSRNPDGVAHAYIKPITNDTWLLGWEDLYGGGDRDYDDVVLNLTFIRSEMVDSDDDGLPDDVEIHGFMDALGHVYYTDPNKWDTDGDGLSDGYEAGAWTEYNGMRYFKIVSNPMDKDSDADGLLDDEELDIGTKPLVEDTDGDSIKDGVDRNPLVYDAPDDVVAGICEIVRIIILGVVFGDMGDIGGWCHWLVGDASDSPFYVLGAILGGLIPIPIADLRDLLQSLANLDAFGSLLNALGFIPGVGDAGKIVGTLGVFLARHADDAKYAGDLTGILCKYFLKYMPDFISVPVFSKLTGGASDKLIGIGMDTATINRLIGNGADVALVAAHSDRLINAGSDPAVVREFVERIYRDVDDNLRLKANLDDTLKVVKNGDGKIRWLEEGMSDVEAKAAGRSSGTGWRHILIDHKQDFINKLGDMSDEQLETLVFDCLQNGIKGVTRDGKDAFIYYVPPSNKPMSVIVGSNGYIQTAYPEIAGGVTF